MDAHAIYDPNIRERIDELGATHGAFGFHRANVGPLCERPNGGGEHAILSNLEYLSFDFQDPG
jgi:hypothetical protein